MIAELATVGGQMAEGRELDERTLSEGVQIRIALDQAKLSARVFQISTFVDDQTQPQEARYRVECGGPYTGHLLGTTAELVSLIGAIGRAG